MKQIQKDKNGKILSMAEYNKDGEMIYFVDYVSGYWCRMKRDERGNIIHYCDSEGFWKKTEYDIHGNEIYIEKSDGFYVKNEYDDKNRLIHSIYSDGREFLYDYQ